MVWYDPRPYLTYRTQKFVLIQEWPVGLTHKTFQILALIYVIYSMASEETWAYSEVPMGTFNAYGSSGDYETQAKASTQAQVDEKVYCGSTAYSYVDSADFQYINGVCDTPPVNDLISKTVTSVFFATAYIEEGTIGFPCTDTDLSDGDDDEASCIAGNPPGYNTMFPAGTGTLERWTNGQCVCHSEVKTVYPYQVENMTLHIEHSYLTSDEILGGLTGGSNLAGADFDYTKFAWKNGTETKYNAGDAIGISVYDMLRGSGIPEAYCTADKVSAEAYAEGCKYGVELDDENRNIPQDANGVYPRLRTTGVNVVVEIKYDNTEGGKAVAENRKVKATVNAIAQTGNWAGPGGEVTYLNPMTGDIGAKSWQATSKYRQGVLFSFTATGIVYVLNWTYLINTLIAGLVLLKFANTIADIHAFYLLPDGASTLLRNKRVEKVSKKSEFAEHGLRAALAAVEFRSFDEDANGFVEAEDIVRAFAKVEGVTAEQAHAVATAIFKDADTSEGHVGSLDYAEFVDCVEGETISIKQYLKNVGDSSQEPNFERCVEVFKKQREKDEGEREQRGGKRNLYSELFGTNPPGSRTSFERKNRKSAEAEMSRGEAILTDKI